ncbi:hypothetical protein EW146_g5059 [Bondarzewia mesenterica]|uniref:Homeobox domain-containing protein n=1 Tax=Bondarzewia mesenterica TaxID=1095465 RepID=A0A4S4LUE9_9AGAM|nr:hypothetical protein EW146_g5059 [Bondarzewia mesenterica]
MKRQHSEENENYEQESRSSPSVSSSHGEGGLADTETDAGPSHSDAGPRQPSGAALHDQPQKPADQPPQAPPPPVKKKRTRTLTTPHQSAVLHALLAQSRFPTTAMREEVGRSIGLSARKVQNQRQKARRPRSQSAAPQARQPQYGPFLNPASSVPGMVQPSFRSAPLERSTSYGAFPGQRSAGDYHEREPYLRPSAGNSSGLNAPLAGPGVPGPSFSFAPRLYPVPMTLGPPPRGYVQPSGYAEQWSPEELAYNPMRGQTSSPETHRAQGLPRPHRDYAIHLPPLVLDESRNTSTGSGGFPPPPLLSAPPRLDIPQPSDFDTMPDSPFARHPLSGPPHVAGFSSRALPRLRIPPPLTVPPTQRWNPTSLSPYAHPGPSITGSSSTTGFARSAFSPTGPPGTSPLSSVPSGTSWTAPSPYQLTSDAITHAPDRRPTRPTRFDPVRAAQSENDAARTPQDRTTP